MSLMTKRGKLRVCCGAAACISACRRLVVEQEVDEVVVDRLRLGERVTSTRGERREATRLLTDQGRSASWIALLLHTTSRSIQRYRHDINQVEEAA